MPFSFQLLGISMTTHARDTKAARLLQLSEEVGRIAGSLATLSTGLPDSAGGNPVTNQDEPEVAQETVARLIRERRERIHYLPEQLCAEPAWNMLLELLEAEVSHRPISVSSLYFASGVPESTALRWLNSMVAQQFVIRRADPDDGRRVFVSLASDTSRALRRYFVEIIQARRAHASPGLNRA